MRVRRQIARLGRVLDRRPPAVTWALASPAPGSLGADLPDPASVEVAPIGAETLSTLTAKINGLAATVTETALVGGGRRGEVTTLWRYGADYEIVWTARTVSGRSSVFRQPLGVRREGGSGAERAALIAPGRVVTPERALAVVAALARSGPERTGFTALRTGLWNHDRVAVQAIEGLPAGYATRDRVKVVVGRAVELEDFLALSLAAGAAFETELELSEELSATIETGLELSEDIIANETIVDLAEALETSTYVETDLAEALDASASQETAIELAETVAAGAIQGLEGEIHERSEARAREEDE